MIKITLYKECILSHEYTEVFHNSCFEDYLNGLTKKIIPDLDLVYYENQGTLIFDYDLGDNDNIYDFNYMKIEVFSEETEESLPIFKFKRYCFISDIRLKNDLCYIDYEEDVWQSYSMNLHIRGSFLSRSKFLNYTGNNIAIKNLPMEYDGHKPLWVERLYNHSDQYVIVLQMQKYNAASLGQSTKRESMTTCLFYLEQINGSSNFNFTNVFSLDMALWLLRKAYEKTQYQVHMADEDFYYQIGNITLIPYNLFNSNNFLSYYFPTFSSVSIATVRDAYDNINNILVSSQSENYICFPKLKSAKYLELAQGKHTIYHWTIENDFKNYSIGTMTNQFELVNNGLDNDVYLYVDWNEFNFDIYLEFDKKMISITNDFVINFPYSYLNGEELSQQRIARTMRNIKAVGNIVEGAADIGLTVGTAGANKALVGMKKIPKNIMNNRVLHYKPTMANAINLQAGKEIGNESSGIIGGITGLIEANAPNYSSSKGTFSYEDALLNAYSGICLKKVIPQNENYVENFINETGYITYQIGGDEFLANYYNSSDTRPTTYNILKFDFVKAYGKFSQSICDKLKDILTNGFKIWYIANV